MGIFGDTSKSKILKKEAITDTLRNALWTFYYSRILESTRERYISDIEGYLKSLWSKHFKQTVDSIPSYRSSWGDNNVDVESTILTIRKYYLQQNNWIEIYSIFEFTFSFVVPPCKGIYINELNAILEEEGSALRFVQSHFIEITNPIELAEIENAAANTKDIFSPVHEHLKASIEYLSKSSSTYYRNSVKESISAIEAMCKILCADEKATLGQALKKLQIHPALEKSFLALYGYTSDTGGIRHALNFGDEDNVEFCDAKFMLVSCSAFINYLRTKLS